EAKRIKKIDVRFTEEEYHIIKGLEETLGISKTDLVRQRLLHGARLTMINAKEMIGELDNIGTELGRSGNNINQLARYANTLNKKSILSPQVMEQFNILFEKYIENQRGLEIVLRKIIRGLGR
ncbi:MAG TPA: plasmid mobilization relaxosome protein MobC, partial [Mucilaginibacter sp.]